MIISQVGTYSSCTYIYNHLDLLSFHLMELSCSGTKLLLVVGGGGGGGNNIGAGGGAGGLRVFTNVPVGAATYPVTIGAGGG